MLNHKMQLHMVFPEESLTDLSSMTPPEGYVLRLFGPGDETGHVAVMRSAGFDTWDEAMLKQWCNNAIPDGIFVAVHVATEEIVATAMATHGSVDLHPAGGELGWVAGSPEHSGLGLGALVCSAVVNRFKDAGYRRIYLKTDDWRLAAVKTYLKLGFTPFLHSYDMEGRWIEVYKALKLVSPDVSWPRAPESLMIAEDPEDRPDSDRIDRYPLRHRWHPSRAHRSYSSHGDTDAFGDESLYKPSALGYGAILPTEITAGTSACLTLTYTAGFAGIPAGTSVSFAIRGQAPLGKGLKQFFVKGPSGCTIEASPFKFTVKDGSLSEGETVTLFSDSFEWTPLAGRREFKVVLNYGDGEPEQRLPAPLTVDILPDELRSLEVTVPSTHNGKGRIGVRITTRDQFDNRVPVEKSVIARIGDQEQRVHLSGGIGAGSISAPGSAVARIALVDNSTDPSTGDIAVSNPSVRSDAMHQRQLYIGDLHCHDFLSEAEGYPDEVYRWAMEDRRLDFVSIVPQSHGWHDNETWTITKYMNERYLREGEFIPFLGFEWQHTGYGDKVIHYLGGDQPYLPVDDPRYSSAGKLYRALRQSDALVVSHHPCYPAGSWCSSTDFDAVETDVERLTEIWSMHGSSEGYDPLDRPLIDVNPARQAMAALRKGLRLGFTGGSDTHSGRPGGCAKEPRPYWGGLTAVWADDLTKKDLFEALYQRRTYALTRARIVLRFTVNDAPMGAETESADAVGISVEAWAPGTIRKIEIMKNTQILKVFEAGKDECHREMEDQTGGNAFYHCRVTLDDGNLAVCSPVWVG